VPTSPQKKKKIREEPGGNGKRPRNTLKREKGPQVAVNHRDDRLSVKRVLEVSDDPVRWWIYDCEKYLRAPSAV